MATQGYDPQKAQAYNQWLQNNPSRPANEGPGALLARIRAEKAAAGIPQGSEGNEQYAVFKAKQREERQQQAREAAGITDAEAGNYAVGSNGQMGAKIADPFFAPPSPDFENDTIEQVAYPLKASAPVSSVTPINYTTTSTETVSGGGSTTIIAGARVPTAQSQQFAAAAAAKQAEIDQFEKDNPSNYIREKQGLPLNSIEQEEARDAKLQALTDQQNALESQKFAAYASTPPTIITTPNTTTTTQTVTTGTTAVNNPVATPGGPDPVVNRQTEVQLGTTPNPIRATATSPLPADGDEALAAAQAQQELIDLRIAAESATPVDYTTEALLLEQELTAQAIADEELNARLDRAADVPLTDEDAALQAQELADLRIAAESASPVDTDPDGLLAQQEAIRQAQDAADLSTALTYEAAPVPLSALNESEFSAPDPQNSDGVNAGSSVTRGLTNQAQGQSTLQARENQPAAADWRVRLRLAPNADYLYKVSEKNGGAGILAPLAATDGVIFPYTPAIETTYQAKYDSYDLTHSNYRGYFYKNSSIENISIKGTFTAQDTREAAYMLAVIHFFKSVTKMFYGQDAQAGTPPPLVYLSGFGKYQFNESPCVVTNFGYSLPTDVDYIRANGFNNIGLNMENRRNQSSGPSLGGSLGTVVAILDRLSNAGLSNGSLTNRPNPSQVNQNVANQTSINSTYVPTKIEISVTLLPMQTRSQVSKQFSLKSFANGSLLAGGGFW